MRCAILSLDPDVFAAIPRRIHAGDDAYGSSSATNSFSASASMIHAATAGCARTAVQ
jgi:hypothetical protein